MAKKEETELYWNLRNQTMAGRKYGESVTEFFGDKARRDKYLDTGAISYTKPETYEAAEEGELVGLRKSVKSKAAEISDLKNKIKQTPKSIKAAKEEIARLEEQLRVSGDGSNSEEVTTLKADVKKLEGQAIDAEIKSEADVKYLTDMVAEIKKTWVAPKEGK